MSFNWLQQYTLHSYKTLDSTNLEAKKLIKNNIIGNHIIWALSQTNGYGKAGRKWESCDGDVSFSIVLEHTYPEMLVCNLLFVTAISIRKTIFEIFARYNIEAKIKLKWPNDIMIDGKKVCGVIIENLKSPQGKSFLVIGIGINILCRVQNNDLIMVSLNDYDITNIDLLTTINDIINNLEQYKLIWSKNGFAPIRSLWMEHAYNIGSEVSIKNGISNISGIFTGIDNSGSINLLTKSGLTVPVSIGEVLFDKNPGMFTKNR